MKAMFTMTGVSLIMLVVLASFVPTTYQETKSFSLLFALTGTAILVVFSEKFEWSYESLDACLLLTTFGLINLIRGELNAALGAIGNQKMITAE